LKGVDSNPVLLSSAQTIKIRVTAKDLIETIDFGPMVDSKTTEATVRDRASKADNRAVASVGHPSTVILREETAPPINLAIAMADRSVEGMIAPATAPKSNVRGREVAIDLAISPAGILVNEIVKGVASETMRTPE
jgi:hypothetical protein